MSATVSDFFQKVAVLARNGWPTCSGLGGRHGSELMAVLPRIMHSRFLLCPFLSGRICLSFYTWDKIRYDICTSTLYALNYSLLLPSQITFLCYVRDLNNHYSSWTGDLWFNLWPTTRIAGGLLFRSLRSLNRLKPINKTPRS